MIHVYNRFAQILVYSFFICFSNAKESRSMTDEDIDNERRDRSAEALTGGICHQGAASVVKAVIVRSL